MALVAISALKGDRPVVLEVATLTDMMDHMIIVGGARAPRNPGVLGGRIPPPCLPPGCTTHLFGGESRS